jgi:hypothetical protein
MTIRTSEKCEFQDSRCSSLPLTARSRRKSALTSATIFRSCAPDRLLSMDRPTPAIVDHKAAGRRGWPFCIPQLDCDPSRRRNRTHHGARRYFASRARILHDERNRQHAGDQPRMRLLEFFIPSTPQYPTRISKGRRAAKSARHPRRTSLKSERATPRLGKTAFQSQVAGSRNRSAMWPPDHCWRLARAGRTSGRDVIERPEERRSKVDPVQRPKTATAFGVKSVQDLKL